MRDVNRSLQDGFILLGFYEYPNLQILFFFIFLTLYILCLVENIILMHIIHADSQLHNPMYFFLCNLSLIDICFTSLIFPTFLLTFLDIRFISYEYCLSQMYIFIALQSNEIVILTVMSYDRYVAICNPLRYHLTLNRRVTALLAGASCLLSFLDPIHAVQVISNFSFCKQNIVDHLFCDLEPLLKLLCGDITEIEYFLRIEAACVAVPSFFLTLLSYVFIIFAISRIQTSDGRFKAFSTCSSHLSVIMTLYMSLFFVYLLPQDGFRNTKLVSLLNTLVVPMLNPLLYSLRNAQVKAAFSRSLSRYLKIYPR
ncbi:hypothetical protein GDO81_017196, partial [Engystomops pustulosus]